MENIALGFPAEREKFSATIETISKHSAESPLHIEVIGDRQQGKSTLLAQIALELSKSHKNIVLMRKEENKENLGWFKVRISVM